jgi:hypothetical protein
MWKVCCHDFATAQVGGEAREKKPTSVGGLNPYRLRHGGDMSKYKHLSLTCHSGKLSHRGTAAGGASLPFLADRIPIRVYPRPGTRPACPSGQLCAGAE